MFANMWPRKCNVRAWELLFCFEVSSAFPPSDGISVDHPIEGKNSCNADFSAGTKFTPFKVGYVLILRFCSKSGNRISRPKQNSLTITEQSIVKTAVQHVKFPPGEPRHPTHHRVQEPQTEQEGTRRREEHFYGGLSLRLAQPINTSEFRMMILPGL